jgi:hypothetical protein
MVSMTLSLVPNYFRGVCAFGPARQLGISGVLQVTPETLAARSSFASRGQQFERERRRLANVLRVGSPPAVMKVDARVSTTEYRQKRLHQTVSRRGERRSRCKSGYLPYVRCIRRQRITVRPLRLNGLLPSVYAQIQKLTLPFRADLRYGSS